MSDTFIIVLGGACLMSLLVNMIMILVNARLRYKIEKAAEMDFKQKTAAYNEGIEDSIEYSVMFGELSKSDYHVLARWDGTTPGGWRD